MTGKELYEQQVADRLAAHDADPPKTVQKDGSLTARKRPRFTAFELLPQSVQDRWNGKAESS